MDNTTDFEIITIINMLKYSNRYEWEQTRLLMYTNLYPILKKGIDVEKFWPMPFDDDIETNELSQDKMEKMKKIGEQYIKKMKKKN